MTTAVEEPPVSLWTMGIRNVTGGSAEAINHENWRVCDSTHIALAPSSLPLLRMTWKLKAGDFPAKLIEVKPAGPPERQSEGGRPLAHGPFLPQKLRCY